MNTGIRVGVANVEVKLLVGNSAAGARDFNLDARRIELGATARVLVECGLAFVVCDDLLADEILSSSQTRWKGKIVLAMVRLELVNSPLGTIVTILGDLGPDGSGSRTISVFRNVGNDGAEVRAVDDIVIAGVVVPLKGESITSSSLDETGRLLSTIGTASHVGARQVLDGAVVVGSSDVDLSAITLVLAIDRDAVHEGMSGDGSGHGQRGSESETHFDRSLKRIEGMSLVGMRMCVGAMIWL